MRPASKLSDVPGGRELVGWFGATPTFHDAEVLSLELRREGTSKLVVSGFRMTSQIDDQGFYLLDRHFVATFAVEGIDTLDLSGFSSQNVLGELVVLIRPAQAGFDLELDPIYGLGGRIGCRQLSVSFEPGSDAD